MNKIKPIKEIELERIYDAPIETIWQTWTNPEILKRWWGPNDVTIPDCVVDLHVGGKFYIVMEATEAMGKYKGTKWPMIAEFTAIVPNSKLVYDAIAWTEGKKAETLIDQKTEITLTKEKDKTKVKVKAGIYKTGPDASLAIEGMQYGFTQQLEKLNNFINNSKYM